MTNSASFDIAGVLQDWLWPRGRDRALGGERNIIIKSGPDLLPITNNFAFLYYADAASFRAYEFHQSLNCRRSVRR